jgi:hypothetical protein
MQLAIGLLTRSALPHTVWRRCERRTIFILIDKGGMRMRFVKVQDEERSGQVAINLDLVREAHFGGGLLHLYFERSATSQDDVTFTGENAQKLWAAMG